MFKPIKEALYQIKLYVRAIFTYPEKRISDAPDTNYDRYWEHRKQNFEIGLNSWQTDRVHIITRELKDSKNLSILDIGCGNGDILMELKKSLDIKKMYGMDVSNKALTLAKANGLETKLADPSKDIGVISRFDNVDVVLMLEVLEHMAAPEVVLREAVQTAKRGVFFSFPNTGFFTFRLRLLFGKFPIQWLKHPSEHLRFWTKRDLQWWLAGLGYEDYQIHTYKGVPFLNKLLPSVFAAAFVVYLPHQEKKEMRKPDFIHLGVPRAGTSTLIHCLAAHPEISSALYKDLNFFNDKGEFYKKTPQPYTDDIDAYLESFKDADPDQKCGEVATVYLMDPNAAERIKKHLPDVKLVISLRHPIERLSSEHNQAFAKQRDVSVPKDINELIEDDPEIIAEGFYDDQLARYFEHFDKEKIFIIIYEKTLSRDARENLIKQLFNFLGVERSIMPKACFEQLNKSEDHELVGLSKENCEKLQNIYAPHIERLENMLEIDLSEWKS